jgi:hypothetical protein
MSALRCRKQPWRRFLIFVQILDRRGKPAAIARVTRPLNNRMTVAYSAIEELELEPRSSKGKGVKNADTAWEKDGHEDVLKRLGDAH